MAGGFGGRDPAVWKASAGREGNGGTGEAVVLARFLILYGPVNMALPRPLSLGLPVDQSNLICKANVALVSMRLVGKIAKPITLTACLAAIPICRL